ncbi:MAG: hypothetical protein JSV24_02145 [Bacteroidales bacterium]|nr:MAG: hypothetical protein JSV24_02145 [Bacteroidales bacterium]
MRKIIVCLSISILSMTAFPQAPFPTGRDIDLFMKSKTMVVLEASVFSDFNIYIKNTIEQKWKITPYEFVNYDEFENLRTDSSYSFLVLTQTSFERDKASVYYNFLNLLLGADVKYLSEMPEFCSMPLSYSQVEEPRYPPKLGLIIDFMQQHVRNLAADPGNTLLRNLSYYNKNSNLVKNKMLLVTSGDLAGEVNTPTKIKATYPHEFKLVSEEEVIEAIENMEPNTVIVHKVGPEDTNRTGWCYKILFGTDDSKLYFFDNHTLSSKRPDGLLERDFRRLR